VCDNLLIYGCYFGFSWVECCSWVDELLEFVNFIECVDLLVELLLGGMKCWLIIVCVFINCFEILLFDEFMMGFDL